MGVHWEMELYFWSTLQTREDLLEVGEDSRELRGRIRIATMMPSSVPLLAAAVVSVGVVEDEGASLVDIVLSMKRSISIECYCYSLFCSDLKRMQRQLAMIV